jgi:hypothetical protein
VDPQTADAVAILMVGAQREENSVFEPVDLFSRTEFGNPPHGKRRLQLN